MLKSKNRSCFEEMLLTRMIIVIASLAIYRYFTCKLNTWTPTYG